MGIQALAGASRDTLPAPTPLRQPPCGFQGTIQRRVLPHSQAPQPRFRAGEYTAVVRQETPLPGSAMRYATVEAVTFSPIPCWAHLSPVVYRARIAEMVESIEAEAARNRERIGASVVGELTSASELWLLWTLEIDFDFGSHC